MSLSGVCLLLSIVSVPVVFVIMVCSGTYYCSAVVALGGLGLHVRLYSIIVGWVPVMAFIVRFANLAELALCCDPLDPPRVVDCPCCPYSCVGPSNVGNPFLVCGHENSDKCSSCGMVSIIGVAWHCCQVWLSLFGGDVCC